MKQPIVHFFYLTAMVAAMMGWLWLILDFCEWALGL
jgi:hypothetical protein